jgi:hypothetical protein
MQQPQVHQSLGYDRDRTDTHHNAEEQGEGGAVGRIGNERIGQQ